MNSHHSASPLELEYVAIVGMACRTAGGNDTPEKLWQFLLDKQCGSGSVPPFRWETWLNRDSRTSREVEKTLRKGYFIEDLENFDASFFGISPKEAELMDPHQRLGLELSWEALENAGINPNDLSKSNTAVYMGIDSDDYSRLLLEDIPNVEAHMGIGTAQHGVANRISYHLDLMGPSAAVDAACASSLVAVHHGRTAIQLGESEVAIVGGVNVLLAPALTRMLEKAGALSSEGVCRSFDDAANGYARGEGGAVLILKRLSSALRDGDRIYSILKGSAVAQDGKTNGIMAPNSDAQHRVGLHALSRSGIDSRSIGYVEAHATSTRLGDPTEISAIAKLYGHGAARPRESPCCIGSIKPNVGHLEAAAGAISLVKAAMAVDKGQLAPQTLLEKLNSRIDWEQSGLEVVRDIRAWPEVQGPRRAAVCSYGYGGTVSHAVIEQHVPMPLVNGNPTSQTPGLMLIVVTAPHERRLAGQAKSLAEWLASPIGKASDVKDIANTLAQRRAHHSHRLIAVVRDHDDAVDLLHRFLSKQIKKNDFVVTGRILPVSSPQATSPVWIFSGHGAQWIDMGKELLNDKVFSRALEEVDSVFKAEAGFSVVQALDTGDFETSERVQIATFAMQYGLSQILTSKGLRPSAVVGHSIGEIAAAVVAGCIKAKQGALIIARRANLFAQVRANDGIGAMALVQLPFSRVEEELGQRTDLVAAIDSSPQSCVVSGHIKAVEQYVQGLRDQDVETFRVKTDIAFHSPMLNQIKDSLRESLSEALQPAEPSIPIYSTSMDYPRGRALRDVDYWVNNMVNPVKLRSAVQAVAEDGHRSFLEVSSHPIVLHSVRETLAEVGLKEEQTVLACAMRRNTSADQTIKLAMAQLFSKGSKIDFRSLFGHKSHWCSHLPNTPWMQKPYYRQVQSANVEGDSLHDVDTHHLLGRRTAIAGTDVTFFGTQLSLETKPFPGTHPLDGTEIIPAGVYINTFHHATGAGELSDIQLRVPVSMTDDIRKVQVTVQGKNVAIASTSADTSANHVNEESWIHHAGCKWTHTPDPVASLPVDVAAVRERIGNKLPKTFAVDFLAKIGVSGIAFPWQVVEHYGNEREMIVEVDMLPGQDTLPWADDSWAPMLDAATSVGSSIFFKKPSLRIISHMDKVLLHSKEPLPKLVYLHVEEASDNKHLAAHVHVLNSEGQLLAQIRSMRFSEVEGGAGLAGGVDSLVHQVDWVPAKFSETAGGIGNVVLISKDMDLVKSARSWMQAVTVGIFHVTSVKQLDGNPELLNVLSQKNSLALYLPESVDSIEQVSTAADEFVWETASLMQTLASHSLTETCRLFVLTNGVFQGLTPTGLAQGVLVGLGRIIAAEHPETWGALIDNDVPGMSAALAMRYVAGYDIIRNIDGLPRRAVMRPLSRKQLHTPQASRTLLPRPDGTYIITGGLGSLGLDTADFLVKKGARRVLLISRRVFPIRSLWDRIVHNGEQLADAICRIMAMEKAGAAVSVLALDIASPNAASDLIKGLDSMQLPRVLGVVHCAGVLEDSLVLQTSRESFQRVMAPKVKGALALHEAFPSGTLDFFVLYSSIGQLVGTAGQASYGASNAFLDAMAMHRRAHGDNAIAMQFTAWRDSVMASSTDFLTVELESKGITDISSEDAFRAWEHLGKYDIASAVVTRCLPIEEGEAVAVPILEDVVPRRPKAVVNGETGNTNGASTVAAVSSRPSDPDALKQWLEIHVRQCIAAVLMMTDISEIDGATMVNDLGIDSVMTVALRKKFQDFFQVKVPPTLTWKYPTVDHMIPWFVNKLQEG